MLVSVHFIRRVW